MRAMPNGRRVPEQDRIWLGDNDFVGVRDVIGKVACQRSDGGAPHAAGCYRVVSFRDIPITITWDEGRRCFVRCW